MFRFVLFASLIIASNAFAKSAVEVSSYSLCEQSHDNNIGLTTEYLYQELDRVVAASLDLSHLVFWSNRDETMYHVRKPIRVPEFSRQRIGQQESWLCLKISEQ